MNTAPKSLPAIGVVVAVDADIATVGVYNITNDPSFIVDGELVSGVKVGAFLLVKQGRFKIVTKVVSEKIQDQQNTVKSKKFDNRFNPDSIQRILRLKVQGVIDGDNHYEITTSKVPMVGNEVFCASEDNLSTILAIPGGDKSGSILIGRSILENLPVYLPINAFFASHIGIFGNTGSGKSNTLHKLYWELFKSKFGHNALEKSHFFIIDFNGEYTKNNVFAGVDSEKREVINIGAEGSEVENNRKLPISKQYFFSPDILSMLLNATVSTQIPFLKNVCRKRKQWESGGGQRISSVELGLFRTLLCGTRDKFEFTRQWIEEAKEVIDDDSVFSVIDTLEVNSSTGALMYQKKFFIDGYSELPQDKCKALRLDEVESKLTEKYDEASPLRQFYILCRFQLVYDCAFGRTKFDYISPLLTRMNNTFNRLETNVELFADEDEIKSLKPLTIVSLSGADKNLKVTVPMLFSQFAYSRQKQDRLSHDSIESTTHLIIDEAHNILNQPSINNFDQWEDYRVKCFEEIIKEGRKFGFFLTLASQRPADISPTIISQIHNFIIHRIVNDRDLKMLDNTMPTLDEYSKAKIPSLGKGEAVLTGTAFSMPTLIKVPFEKASHPNSDDIKLTERWS